MSLADELLADLEENDHEDEEEDEPMEAEEQVEEKEEKPDIKQLQMEIDTTQIQSVRGIYILIQTFLLKFSLLKVIHIFHHFQLLLELCKLRDSTKVKTVMQQIENYGSQVRKATDIIGPVEADPEYQLIVEANDLAADIDNEVVRIVNI